MQALRYDILSDQVMPVELHLEGYAGIVFQHELDHLDGILYTTKIIS